MNVMIRKDVLVNNQPGSPPQFELGSPQADVKDSDQSSRTLMRCTIPRADARSPSQVLIWQSSYLVQQELGKAIHHHQILTYSLDIPPMEGFPLL